MDAEGPVGVLSCLPDEIIEYILFGWMFKFDLSNLERVCRYLHERVQWVKKSRGLENLWSSKHLTTVTPTKWDRFRFEGGILYFHWGKFVDVFGPGESRSLPYDDLPGTRITSAHMLPNGGAVLTGYGDIWIYPPPLSAEGKIQIVCGGKSVVGTEVRNEKIYSADGSVKAVNVWSLTGVLARNFTTPFFPSEVILSSGGSIIFVYFKLQNKLHGYREDTFECIKRFNLGRDEPSVVSMTARYNRLYVLMTSGNINIYNTLGYSFVFLKVIEHAKVFDKVKKTVIVEEKEVINIDKNVSRICPFGNNILVMTGKEFLVVSVDSGKILAHRFCNEVHKTKVAGRVRTRRLAPVDFTLGPSGDLEFLYCCRDTFE